MHTNYMVEYSGCRSVNLPVGCVGIGIRPEKSAKNMNKMTASFKKIDFNLYGGLKVGILSLDKI